MAVAEIRELLNMVPIIKQAPHSSVWLNYDEDADILYVHYERPNHATDSELTDDDVIVRYDGERVIGLTILHASRRQQ
jgi:uncharacterized protein YuzE